MNLEDANWAHFYRKKYGDAGFDPVMFLFEEDDAEEKIREGLLERSVIQSRVSSHLTPPIWWTRTAKF